MAAQLICRGKQPLLKAQAGPVAYLPVGHRVSNLRGLLVDDNDREVRAIADALGRRALPGQSVCGIQTTPEGLQRGEREMPPVGTVR
jgi:hypothetical protein